MFQDYLMLILSILFSILIFIGIIKWSDGMCDVMADLNTSMLIARGKYPSEYSIIKENARLLDELSYDGEVASHIININLCHANTLLNMFKTAKYDNSKARIYFKIDDDPIIEERKRQYQEHIDKMRTLKR